MTDIDLEATEAIREHLEERTAIQEYDGGLTRARAEAEARQALRVYVYRLAEGPDTWLVMIAPGCNLAEAIRECNRKFGADRVLGVREYSNSVRRKE